MKQYITGRKRSAIIAFAVSLFILHACTDDADKIAEKKNLSLIFSTRAGETAAGQIPTMRLFTFHNNPGSSDDKMFRQEILNLTRGTNEITAQVETGEWNMALVSTPNGGTILSPNTTVPMAELPMYKYTPTLTAGRSSNAHEIYLDNRTTPTITSGGSAQMPAQLNRTVAKVELIINKTTPNFNLSGTHSIKLHHVPSTLSYTGALLPNKTNPDTLVSALQAPVVLMNGGSGSYAGTESISFVIPAHRGSDFLYVGSSGSAQTDTTTLKMKVTVDLERTGGTRFTKQAEIPYVAKANKILRVYITVNDGLEFQTEVLPWEGVDLSSTVGEGYQNWLYVVKDVNGSGLSWSDPLPNINAAITKANALMGANITVNGILVAGGANTSMLYSESFTVPDNVKIYGGWEGAPNTELLSTATAADVHASTHRDLKTYKVRLATGTGNVELSGANAVLDGFVVSGSGSSSAAGLVTVSNATAWANAIEIDQQTISSSYALAMSAGTGTNILVSRNTKGVSVESSGKLVNATIANNTAASVFSGILYNSVYWGNSGTATTAGTINYCAFQGTVPSGTNYPLHNTNDTWFTASNAVPGPHFDLGITTGLARYEAGTAKPNRAPMLRRGNKAVFDSNLPIAIADQYKKDINGNIRYHIAIDGSTQVVDIGCYEADALNGFQLMWASDRIYISSKKGYVSETPLMLPANADPDINIEISWTVTVAGTGTLQYGAMVDTPPINGTGDGYVVGNIKIKTLEETSSTLKDVYGNYNGNSERQCGTLRISSSLGNYLSDANMEVWQTPGKSEVWYEGYVGSFHRSEEVGSRYVTGTNTGNWTVRIISGLDWIKIDNHDKDYGNIISSESYSAGGYSLNYREVEEAWGGVVSGSGNIKFRVGMKSKNTTGTPRYGLIVITRSGGVAMFFVRQGQEADYLYGPNDERTQGTRTAAKKFSPFSLGDPANGTDASKDLGAKGGEFVRFPSQVGYFFQKNQTIAYLRGAQTSNLPTISTSLTWSASNDVCPSGYRHATYTELIHSCYQHVAVPTTNASITGQEGDDAKANFVWGRYADGWYDQLAPDPVLTTTEFLPSAVPTNAAQRPFVATKGMLMVNHYNYAALFFPTSGTMVNTSPTTVGQTYGSTNYGTVNTAMFRTSTHVGTTAWGNTHWLPGHVGTTCTSIATSSAAYVRCVLE